MTHELMLVPDGDRYAFTGEVASELLIHEFDGRTFNCRTGSGLGGFELAEAIKVNPGNAGSTHARVEFHGGMNMWQFVTESSLSSLARGQHTRVVGSLSECLQRFEQETGLQVPPIALVEVGKGITMVTSKTAQFDALNAFRLPLGAKYKVPLSSGAKMDVMVVKDKAGRAAFAQLDEDGLPQPDGSLLAPSVLLTERALLAMRRIEPAVEPSSAVTPECPAANHEAPRLPLPDRDLHSRASYRRNKP
jgi:hypothetical protein